MAFPVRSVRVSRQIRRSARRGDRDRALVPHLQRRGVEVLVGEDAGLPAAP